MQRSTFRLSRPSQAVVYLSFGLLLVSGAGWMFVQQFEGEIWRNVLPQLLKLHGAAAMFALLVLGSLTQHIKRGWKADKNRLSGALLLGLNVFLIVTGYGLYYAGSEEMREWLSRWHAWIGLGTFILLPAHVVMGRLIIRQLQKRKKLGNG